MIYAIGDLHFSFSKEKPMSIFGEHWKNHHIKIRENWNRVINDDDLVVICGDISWAMKLEDSKADLTYINELKGEKVLIKGNHDLWWPSNQKISQVFKDMNYSMKYIHNNAYVYNNIAICGTRGWVVEGAVEYTAKDKKIYLKEAKKLENSLKSITAQHEHIIVAMHFPPMNEKRDESLFVKLFKEYGVKTVVYGHLHGREAFANAPIGIIGGINYQLVSADYLDFKLKAIEE